MGDFDFEERRHYFYQMGEILKDHNINPHEFDVDDIVITPEGVPVITDWNKLSTID